MNGKRKEIGWKQWRLMDIRLGGDMSELFAHLLWICHNRWQLLHINLGSDLHEFLSGTYSFDTAW